MATPSVQGEICPPKPRTRSAAAQITRHAPPPPATVKIWPSCHLETAYFDPRGHLTGTGVLVSENGILSRMETSYPDGAQDYTKLDLTRSVKIGGANALGFGFRQLSLSPSNDGPSTTLGGDKQFILNIPMEIKFRDEMASALGEECITPVELQERPLGRPRSGVGVPNLFLH